MQADHAARTIGLVGIASFVCIVAAALISPPLWDAPDSTASALRVAAYVEGDRSRLLASLFVYSVAIGLFLWFASALAAWLRATGPGSPVGATVFLAGAVVLVALILAGFAPAGVNAYRSQTPAMAQALYDMTFALLAISGIPTALCLGRTRRSSCLAEHCPAGPPGSRCSALSRMFSSPPRCWRAAASSRSREA